MSFLDSLRWLSRALLAQRTRSLLTLLGMTIGISAVCLLSALGEGLRNYIMSEFTQFGSHIVAITPGKTETFGIGGILNTLRPLSLQDSHALRQVAGVRQVLPVVFGTARLTHGGRARYANVAGITAEAQQVWRLQVAQGRFLPDDPLENPRAFVVLGSRVRQELFGEGPALGQYLGIGGSRYRVAGVLRSKGQFMGTDLDDTVYIPVARGLQLFNRDSLMELDVVYAANLPVAEISERIRRVLIARHRVEDFTLITQDEVLSTLDKILRMVKYAAGGLGAISLLVGAVGILSIMLITTTERTGEIGLLRALGFSAGQIRNLFLAEAVALALVGGLIGVLLTSMLIGLVHLLWPALPLSLTPGVVLLALGLSTLIGALAGVRPAQRAASLNPIEALRYQG
ncbi:ABC transporter permease [Marinobacterium arenosum]|uniref:ABC transporter permease n=1 Tax=Marinobacterium arenosum TaxID=2862496 RepID=UPI001C944ED7|nr:ABC transporter permease [Marinobacterium arenosum]MBY4675110.1 ABC transporter permease [Marinobacterium arenosum]